MARTMILTVSFLMLCVACRPPQSAQTTASRQAAKTHAHQQGEGLEPAVLSDCIINGESAQTYYQCDADFREFIYTDGNQRSHVFEQTPNNPCVWVSSTVGAFHLTSTPIGADPNSIHVTFQNNNRCPVIILGTDCSSAPDSRCAAGEKDIAIAACTGFAVACAAR